MDKTTMKWKTLFFLLLGANIVIISTLLFFILQPSDEVKKIEAVPNANVAELTVHSSKEHLNLIINDYIKKKTKNHPLQYEIRLTDRVHLKSKIPLFGREVDFLVTFEPKVVDNGNLKLVHPEMTLGELRLPVNYILKYLQKNASLPEGVVIHPTKSFIYVHLNEINLNNGYRIQAKKFDLANDEIVLTLLVPIRSK
ncbi:MAG TPA: YpmS family protein [Anoxybacillus sp.]|nr:YpmS family protein [Anoxybacillus sp.]